jgi:hypothetical protein
MSVEPSDSAENAFYERLYHELGPRWAEDHRDELLQEHYDDIVQMFTSERLDSYYVAHPTLAHPANGSLVYAQKLMPDHPKAALVFATTAVELVIKNVLLKPIVFGLVHTEGLAAFITELTTQHTGMDRFQELLTEILSQFGGVDLKTFKRTGSARTVWQEIGEIQKARNAVVHRGEAADDTIRGPCDIGGIGAPP